ncbi:MAG: hypothetical protein QNJ98_15075 [Planctomycetota bacterium]|nr:hypothetical protein [Planctomycetota bacterium]
MRTLSLLLVAFSLVALLGGGTALAKGKEELPKPHGDDLVKERLKRFEKDYASDDMDERIKILKWISMHRHKKVVALLKKIYLKEKNLELVATAGAGLALQTSHPKQATKIALQGLEKYAKLAGKTPETEAQRLQEDLEASVLVAGLTSYKALGQKIDWKKMKGFLDHNNDDVAIAMIKLCEARLEYKAIPVIYEWFHHYPDGLSWEGGSVKVDTGAAGDKDAKAAKAKWKAKYGGRAKKARPNAFKAMVECVHVLTGEKITKRVQLKEWMDANKKFLKKHGV